MPTPGLLVFATLMSMMIAVSTAGAADQTPPPKPGVVAPQTTATTPDDMFSPPMRGTPGGRISGGTRGLHPVSPATSSQPKPPASSAGGGSATKTTQEAQLPVVR
jgi:hypothetical protein